MYTIPVIHHLTNDLSLQCARQAHDAGAFGVFLISMDGDNDLFPSLAASIKGKYPNLKVGINLLGESVFKSFEVTQDLGLDMFWSDDPIVTSQGASARALQLSQRMQGSNLLHFNSVAFKYQAAEASPEHCAKSSASLGFIPTTSGSATGNAPQIEKIQRMKEAIGSHPLACASGLTPQNVELYAPHLTYGLVCTGISKNYHEFDTQKLSMFVQNAATQ